MILNSLFNMKILCWNIAGIRAKIKKNYLDFLADGEYDIVCWQETKAEEKQVILPEIIKQKYPYRYWNSCNGKQQRKGLNGTSIWSKIKPINILPPLDISVNEGRVTALEFSTFILITVYTPNSQYINSDRNMYRVNEWDIKIKSWIENLNKRKPTIICGDFNVANKKIDIAKPEKWKKAAGFLDSERINFKKLLLSGWHDAFRYKHKNKKKCYTYWNQRIPWERKANIGWRIDYFLVPTKIKNKIVACDIHKDIMGSDHCPISLNINIKKRLKIVDLL